ncbi:putative sulfate exporter family transporter [Pontibacter korlensis]|uniref:Membrane protein n=1 Tax=Pontibacter korlensis TaxID=400092 RepID=A0A0E3UY19_9BACT|nr:putative sulfate exporter family transporter [Pontibacter korlensis]AKD04071.1 membrane protein [Pontibacter korlensis]
MDAENKAIETTRGGGFEAGEKPSFIRRPSTRQFIFLLLLLLCLTPLVGPPLALLLGFVMAQTIGHPFLKLNHKATHWLLQTSVVGLGFGMNAHSALQAGREGVLLTIASIAGTLALGALLGRWLHIERKTSQLISSGTAICGGSAIAAMSPVIRAGEQQISVALGVVFILNSIALFTFPVVGHWLDLTQTQFGLWCAIAIHDTSSVVGAASKYGAEALEIATTVKLARALWIIPVALGARLVSKSGAGKVKVPYFIGLFILAMLANTYLPAVQEYGRYAVGIAKTGLTLTLFLIGAGLSRQALRSVGVRPLLQGGVLWGVISLASLWAIIEISF